MRIYFNNDQCLVVKEKTLEECESFNDKAFYAHETWNDERLVIFYANILYIGNDKES